jgi:hypothetical protein
LGLKKRVALLISYYKGVNYPKASMDAVQLYEALTCNGTIGPSDILLLAKRSTPYSDNEPTIANVERAFQTLCHSSHDRKECIIFLDGCFDDYGMQVMDQTLDLDLISALIETLSCGSAQVFLHGPRSDQAFERLMAPGRTLVFSSRSDREEKVQDPFMVPRIFKGDEVHLSRVQAERGRLKTYGFDLNWVRSDAEG